MTTMTSDLAHGEGLPPELDPARPLVASGNLRRRHVVSTFFSSLAVLATAFAVAVMVIVLWTVVSRGGSVISWDFLTKAPPLFGGAGGGIGAAIAGTGLIVAIATAIAMPLGILIALYTSEFASPRARSFIRLVLDLLNGLPSIVIGIFAFGLLVAGHHQSAFAGSFALSIIMLPLIARASQESLAQVPNGLREAANALGVGRRQSVLGVILPSAMSGILTGTILAVARAAGETAPLLIVSSIYKGSYSFDFFGSAIPNIPVEIFRLSESADPAGYERAWGAALVLVIFILATSVLGRMLFARSKAKASR
ncbi:MAG: phosphate ABC transporter permease PstA [Solirubrobacteraceae bacterium]